MGTTTTTKEEAEKILEVVREVTKEEVREVTKEEIKVVKDVHHTRNKILNKNLMVKKIQKRIFSIRKNKFSCTNSLYIQKYYILSDILKDEKMLSCRYFLEMTHIFQYVGVLKKKQNRYFS